MNGVETLTAGGIRWRRYGAGGDSFGSPPLVVLHGLFGSGDNWQSQARALSEETNSGKRAVPRAVLVPDLPNHGDSFHTDTFTYPELASLLWRVLPEVLPAGSVEILGHSMGGKIAMAMALEQPANVSRLVVVDIAPRKYEPRHQTILEAMQAVAHASPRSRSEAERVLARSIPEKPVRLFLLKSLVPDETKADGRYRWQLNLDGIIGCYDSIRDWPYEPGARRYDGPVLFIKGALSPYISDTTDDRIGPFFPSAVVRAIENAGHWVHAEQRDTFLDVVRDDNL